jgi:hypothetical protein
VLALKTILKNWSINHLSELNHHEDPATPITTTSFSRHDGARFSAFLQLELQAWINSHLSSSSLMSNRGTIYNV